MLRRVLRWLGVALLVWGLFVGIAYALAPLVTDRWGGATSTLVGFALVGLCAAGLSWINPGGSS